MNLRRIIQPLLVSLTTGLLAACAAHPPSPAASERPKPVWPAPPSEPRIAYVQDVRGPADIGQKPSVWRTMANWVTGDSGESQNLHRPFAVAMDENGNLCLTDMDTASVYHADFAHKKWRRFDHAGKTRFASPVAVAHHGGIFFVADSELGKVFAFRDDGKVVFELGSPLVRPVGLAMDGDDLFVVDSQAHAVFVFSLDGRLKFKFGQRGTKPGEFNFPTCIVADQSGRVLVADTMNCRVQMFDRAGNFVSTFGSNGDTSGHFARPKGIAVDAAGNRYVVDAMFDNFQIFNETGRLLLNVGEAGAAPGEFALPNGIAIGPDGKIYVADAFNRRVQVFKPITQP